MRTNSPARPGSVFGAVAPIVFATLIVGSAAGGTAQAATVRVDLVDVRFEGTGGSGAPDGSSYAVTGFFVAETNPDFGPDMSPFLFGNPTDFAIEGLTRTYVPANADGRAVFDPPQPDPRATGVAVTQLDPEATNPETGNPSVDDVTLRLLFDVAAADALRGAPTDSVVPLSLIAGSEQGVRFEPREEDSFAIFVGELAEGSTPVVTATVLSSDVPPIPLPAAGLLLPAALGGLAAARVAFRATRRSRPSG